MSTNHPIRPTARAPRNPRRDFLGSAAVLTAALPLAAATAGASTTPPSKAHPQARAGRTRFWPDGAQLVISISMQFEAGAQPERGASGPFPALDPKYPDPNLATVLTLSLYGIRWCLRGPETTGLMRVTLVSSSTWPVRTNNALQIQHTAKEGGAGTVWHPRIAERRLGARSRSAKGRPGSHDRDVDSFQRERTQLSTSFI